MKWTKGPKSWVGFQETERLLLRSQFQCLVTNRVTLFQLYAWSSLTAKPTVISSRPCPASWWSCPRPPRSSCYETDSIAYRPFKGEALSQTWAMEDGTWSNQGCPGNFLTHLITFFHSHHRLVRVLKKISVSPLPSTMGRGCSTAVEHTPHNQEVLGLNPSGCWAFFYFYLFLLSFASGVSLIVSLKEVYL